MHNNPTKEALTPNYIHIFTTLMKTVLSKTRTILYPPPFRFFPFQRLLTRLYELRIETALSRSQRSCDARLSKRKREEQEKKIKKEKAKGEAKERRVRESFGLLRPFRDSFYLSPVIRRATLDGRVAGIGSNYNKFGGVGHKNDLRRQKPAVRHGALSGN